MKTEPEDDWMVEDWSQQFEDHASIGMVEVHAMAVESVEANSIAEDAPSDDTQSVGSASSVEAAMEYGTTVGAEYQWDDQWNLGWSGHPRHMRPINAWTWQVWHNWSGKQLGVETREADQARGSQ